MTFALGVFEYRLQFKNFQHAVTFNRLYRKKSWLFVGEGFLRFSRSNQAEELKKKTPYYVETLYLAECDLFFN